MDTPAPIPGMPNLITVNQQLYTYRVAPFVLTNTLGSIRATLKQYIITGPAGETYQLYKTTERNWYDVENANPGADKALLRSLKFEIDYQGKMNL